MAINGQKTVPVKVVAQHQSVPPAAIGLPFVAVDFDGLMVTPHGGRGQLPVLRRVRHPGAGRVRSRQARQLGGR